jgi:hypothetical protein
MRVSAHLDAPVFFSFDPLPGCMPQKPGGAGIVMVPEVSGKAISAGGAVGAYRTPGHSGERRI